MTPIKDTLKQFDEQFEGVVCDGTGSFNQEAHEDIKSFLRSALNQQRQEIVEMVEGMKENIDFSLPDGYDQPPDQRAIDEAEMRKYQAEQNIQNRLLDRIITLIKKGENE